MTEPDWASDRIIDTLRERAKELHCLYTVHELLGRADASVHDILHDVVDALPAGWQYPSDCFAKLTLGGEVYQPPRVDETGWVQRADIMGNGKRVGALDVFYTRERPAADEGPFLKEERKLLDTIATWLGEFAVERRLAVAGDRPARGDGTSRVSEWPLIVDFLRHTDAQLLGRLARRMINQLCWMGVEGAETLLAMHASRARDTDEQALDGNRPLDRGGVDVLAVAPDDVFALAAEHMAGHEILSALERWIRDDKGGFLLETLDHLGSTVGQIGQALERFEQLHIDDRDLSRPKQIGLRVGLARRLLTDDPAFVDVAKDYLTAADYADLMRRALGAPGSHGKLGGKSAGLLLADAILRRSGEYADVLGDVKIPRTWYVLSDALLDFIDYNHLDDVYSRKYLEIGQIRRDYPRMIQVFKHSRFPPEIVKGLSVLLDDFNVQPLIVRSSSLLEDRMGAAFSGKYKSLFLSNQGTKRERLGALMDAIAEVYASLFGPDPIEYRTERGLVHFHEEMAVMIQEVVGTRVGRYFLPAYAGVAYSQNELRWSPRIRRDDGLVRMVPGLGTRAVDRLSDDYPVLVAPGQPGLRVNVAADEVRRYSPRRIDLIDLDERGFRTMEIGDLVQELGREFPACTTTLSTLDPDGGRRPVGFQWDPRRESAVVTFDALIERTPFIPTIRAMLRVLREKLGGPVDIEFASDGRQLFLLQCRFQSFGEKAAPAAIPHDVPSERLIFSAHRYVTDGRLPDITHIVYVDADRYGALATASELLDVGRAVGRLNLLLPKRQFVLIGPGRWGSRGDVKLGVSVTYSDINNAAMLLEVARQRGHYVPEVSFGTHFFQDLVESGIRYLPLYPDDKTNAFNEAFLLGARNLLADMVPEYASLRDVVRVIDVGQASGGLVLRILMNADRDEAVGLLAPPESAPAGPVTGPARPPAPQPVDHWRWRLSMAERIAADTDPDRFGVRGMYVFGSTKNATAGPASDIDLIVHVNGTEAMRHDLEMWLEGWSRALAEMNYLRTGVRTDGLLEAHIVTDDDIARGTSYAVKIGAVTDAARALVVGSRRG